MASNPGTSKYPASLDDFADPGTATYEDDTGYDHHSLHSQVHDAIENIEDTLGTTAGTSVVTGWSAGDFAMRIGERQGGNADNWDVAGTATQTVTTPLLQCGVITATIGSAGNAGTVGVTFPTTYSYKPIVLTNRYDTTGATSWGKALSSVKSIGTASCVVNVEIQDGGTVSADMDYNVSWIAIGEK